MDEIPSFSGHQSFPFRNTWLTKGVYNCARDPEVFVREDAIVTLGVGKNMVQSIRHWCLATNLLEEDPEIKHNRGRKLRPTELARKIFLTAGAWDPYLEDIGTLWLIHWLLVTNPHKATTWHFAFNQLNQPEFTRSGLEQALVARYQGMPNVRFNQDTLRRDVDVFVFQESLQTGLTFPMFDVGRTTFFVLCLPLLYFFGISLWLLWDLTQLAQGTRQSHANS